MNGATLRERRIAANLGQAALAKLIRVSRSSVSHWENDRGAPDAKEERRLEEVLSQEVAARGRVAPSGSAKNTDKSTEKSTTKSAAKSKALKGVIREIDLTALDLTANEEPPRAAGVAVLHDAGGKPLWAGKAKNLRRKLKRLEREPWFARAVRATVMEIHRRRMREKVADLLLRVCGLES